MIGLRSPFGGSGLSVPGRAALEWAVLCAAAALLFPELAVVSVAFALRSRRQGSSRWAAALAAALWCGLLGVVLRVMLGERIVP